MFRASLEFPEYCMVLFISFPAACQRTRKTMQTKSNGQRWDDVFQMPFPASFLQSCQEFPCSFAGATQVERVQ